MKYLLAIVLSLSMILVTVPSAKADNSEEVIIGVLGGALGGLIIGEALGNNRRERHVERVYVYEDPYYEPYCYVKKVRYYDPYRDVYVVKKRRVCE